MGCGGLVVSVRECKRLGRYPMRVCERGGDVCLCQGDSQGGAPAPLGGGLLLSPYVFSLLIIRVRSGLGHMRRATWCGVWPGPTPGLTSPPRTATRTKH